MTDLASLQIKVESQQVKTATENLSGLSREGQKAEKATDGLGTSSRKTDVETGKLARSVGGLIARYAGLTAAVATVQRLARAGMDAAAAVERQSTSLGILLGDMRAGSDLFRELQEFSAQTPLAVNDLSDAAQMLMSFGVEAENVTDTLQMLGDASLGNSQKLDTLSRAYGRVLARGRASMEEVNMAMEAGLPIIAELADAMDVAESEVFDLISAGKVSASTFQEAFRSMTSEGGKFHNGMETLSETFDGKLSTAMDNVRLLGATMFEPMIERGKVALDVATNLAQELRENISGRRLAREVRRGDTSMSDLSTEEQLLVLRANIQDDINRAERMASRGLSTQALDEALARLDNVNRALERVRNGAESAGDQIQKSIREQLERAHEEAEKWFKELEYGFLDSTSGLETRIEREFDVIDRTAQVADQIGWEYDALGEKAAVLEKAITDLLQVDPTEFGGSWDEAYKLADPSIQNLMRDLEEIRRLQEELAGPDGVYLGAMPTIPGIGDSPRALEGSRDQSGISEYIANLERQRETLGMNRLELIEYEMAMMGATKAELEHSQTLQMSIDRSQLLATALNEVAMMAADVALEAFQELGRALYEAGDAGAAMEAGLWSLLDSFIQMLPQLLMMAGIQLIALGQWQLGLGLIAASGLAAMGAGAWEAHKDQTRTEIEGRASGGSVHGGTPYIVGERGPELFVPRTGGDIVSNSALAGMGGGGGNVNVQVINQAPGVIIERQESSGPSGRDMKLFVKAATREAIIRGEVDDAMSVRYGVRKRGVSRS